MSLNLRVGLIVVSFLFFVYIIKNVRKNKLRSDYAMGWLLLSIALLVLSIFPQIAYFVGGLFSVISISNIVFAAVLFMLIVLNYILFTKVSKLEEKQKNLIQEIAILKENNKLK
ncbi:hypothetical protein SAMN05216514_10730 [Kandleria vitulina]|uniref:DUF2304 domain-containing protein n=1 Tax=Kandleria vitulina TaxID=1630 RepID=UPI0008D69076|nr:DUF2304 domain-containing protein [Kandleria vitulina]SEI97476.1 hypothetical protein SAMN05216514_10730 [Kandleria vitulina]